MEFSFTRLMFFLNKKSSYRLELLIDIKFTYINIFILVWWLNLTDVPVAILATLVSVSFAKTMEKCGKIL